MAGQAGLADHELETLRAAGEWGMLTDLAGWKVLMTGKMSLPRHQLAVLVEAAGGTFTNTMSSGVRLLVAPKEDHFSTKVQKAEQQGVRIMTEEEFIGALLPQPEDLLAGRRRRFASDQLSGKPVK